MKLQIITAIVLLIFAVGSLMHDYITTKNKLSDSEIKNKLSSDKIK